MRDRFAFFLAIIASIALHVCLILIHTPATQAAVPVVIELVTTSSIETGDNTLSGGPPAARQDLPPQQAPETTSPPSPPEPQPVEEEAVSQSAELPEQTPSQEPAATEEGSENEPSVAAEVSSTPTTDVASTEVPSGGFPGGMGLPGGGNSANGLPAGSGGPSGEPSASKEKYFIPYYKVDRPPRIIQKAGLEYPVQAKRRNLEATVILEADIDEAGVVQAVRVIKAAGFGFDEAAKKYIQDSKFSPAYIGEKPVAVLMRFSIQFALSD